MAGISSSAWKIVLALAGVGFVLFFIFSANPVWAAVVLLLLLALAGGAFLYRKQGPPER